MTVASTADGQALMTEGIGQDCARGATSASPEEAISHAPAEVAHLNEAQKQPQRALPAQDPGQSPESTSTALEGGHVSSGFSSSHWHADPALNLPQVQDTAGGVSAAEPAPSIHYNHEMMQAQPWEQRQQQPLSWGNVYNYDAAAEGWQQDATAADHGQQSGQLGGSYMQQEPQPAEYPDQGVYTQQGSHAGVVPFVPSPRTPGFRTSYQQPPAAMWGSQIRTQSAADAGLVPLSATEGMRMTHGRPPCALLAWGFGGRVAVIRPRPQGEGEHSVGCIEVTLRSL